MKRFLFDCGTRDNLASGALLVMRVGFGLMMLIGHGWNKLSLFSNPEVKNGWTVPSIWPLSYMSPPVSMMATIFAEVGCSALLVLGLATRPAAFILGFAMSVAAFQVHADSAFFFAPGVGKFKELAVLYLVPCVALIISGAGQYSLDSAIYKEKKKRFF